MRIGFILRNFLNWLCLVQFKVCCRRKKKEKKRRHCWLSVIPLTGELCFWIEFQKKKWGAWGRFWDTLMIYIRSWRWNERWRKQRSRSHLSLTGLSATRCSTRSLEASLSLFSNLAPSFVTLYVSSLSLYLSVYNFVSNMSYAIAFVVGVCVLLGSSSSWYCWLVSLSKISCNVFMLRDFIILVVYCRGWH